eukprot:3074060-Prymnesium_polylepis.1
MARWPDCLTGGLLSARLPDPRAARRRHLHHVSPVGVQVRGRRRGGGYGEHPAGRLDAWAARGARRVRAARVRVPQPGESHAIGMRLPCDCRALAV